MRFLDERNNTQAGLVYQTKEIMESIHKNLFEPFLTDANEQVNLPKIHKFKGRNSVSISTRP